MPNTLPNLATTKPFLTFTVKQRSVRSVTRNIRRVPKEFDRRIPDRVRYHGLRTLALAQQESPWDTGETYFAHVLEFSEGGYTYTVGVDPAPFVHNGEAYYPAFVHEGTSRQAANPWLRRAFLAQDDVFRREMAREHRKALRRIGGA